jgi:glycosyltransferase involved in cell wall biosynthesis
MKEVCFIIPSYNGGGAERATINIADELSLEEQVDVSLIVLDDEGPLKDEPERVETVEFQHSRARYSLFDLWSCLNEIQPNAVFSTLQQTNILVYLIDQLTCISWKTICMLQNYYEKIVSQESFLISYLLTKSLEDADVVTACSEGAAHNLIENSTVSKDDVRVIYNPIEIDNVQKLSHERVDEDAFHKHPVLLGCGRLEEQKGFSYFIEALPEIQEVYPDAQIVLLGDGTLREDLEKQAKELHINDSVHFFGFVDNPYKYMRAADVFVLSSLWEGFGNVVVEALACGTPIISTDCPSGPGEILENGTWGTLIPTEDSSAIAESVRSVLQGNENFNRNGEKRAEDFRPAKIRNNYARVIDNA